MVLSPYLLASSYLDKKIVLKTVADGQMVSISQTDKF
jgi:hypothetical protein